jgi:hypothetical protein
MLPTFAIGQWSTRIYGFADVDFIHDSTQAFNDLGGMLTAAIPKNYDYTGSRDKMWATARNSRLGVLVRAPDFAGIRPTFTLEGDFMGNQPAGVSEQALVTNAAFRLRLAAIQLDNDTLNVLVGQAWDLFGFQPYFVPASDCLQPLPGAVSKRDIQLRLTHTFKTQPLDIQLGISGNRPPQAAAGVPEGQAGLRVFVNDWRGLHTPGLDGQRTVGTTADPLTLAVSGSFRHFRVADFEATTAGSLPDNQYSSYANGYAIAANALIPVIPRSSAIDRSNALTLTGEFTTGTGYADLLGGLVSNQGGPDAPVATYPMVVGSPDLYVPNIDNGLVTYDNNGNLHTIDWTTFVVGAQYYLPFLSGRIYVSVNYAEAHSDNVASWADPGQTPFIFDKTQYYDGNAFWDISPSIRTVLSYQHYQQTFADGEMAHNDRVEWSWFYWF